MSVPMQEAEDTKDVNVDDGELAPLFLLGQKLIDQIFAYASLSDLKSLVERDAPLWFQDAEGISALHAAAYTEREDVLKWLLEAGAVWNAVDSMGYTAGDIALSFNNASIYRTIRDAGLRSEFLLTHLSKKNKNLIAPPSSLILRASDDTAAGSQGEFLSSKLMYTKDKDGQDICLVKSGDEDVGVMMGWERGIMQETVKKLCLDHPDLGNGLKVLNVGFGLGIIDSFIQASPTPPQKHVIIEAHPDVLAHMKSTGWYDMPDVTVLEGRWQDIIEGEVVQSVGGFDVVYTDTFSEAYEDLRQFFEQLPDLLAGPQSKFGFFNGLGATNPLFYDVYTQLSELHLAEVGLETTWHDVNVSITADEAEDGRWGDTRKYFTVQLYRMPVSRMKDLDL